MVQLHFSKLFLILKSVVNHISKVILCTVTLFFFFFQAEDGIRDVAVTGVQTCALPISAADAFTLFEKFEEKLERYPTNLPRAAVELAKDWRSDRVLRRLEALLVVADNEHGYVISGSGELIEPDDGVLAIGSGGSYALAAARALIKDTKLDPAEIVGGAPRRPKRSGTRSCRTTSS